MATKRKDNRNRVLEKGESQREDGTYMYRWTDLTKKRQTIYAKTLAELREKELEITRTEKISGITWDSGGMTVRELVNLYREMRVVKITTKQKYAYFDNLMDKIGISDMKIRDIRTSVAKAYMIELRNLGYSYGTIQNFKASLSPAFQMAVEDDYIIKNPFLFQLHYIIEDDRKERFALSVEDEKKYLDFVKNHGWFKHSYAEILIMLRTGLRVSELYGLTFKDLDFKNNRINVNKQLHYIDGKYVIMSPKSKAGTRVLAMTPEVRELLKNQYSKPRPTTEYVVDGHAGFVFVNKCGKPKYRKNLQMTMISIRDKYAELGLGDFSKVTPHVLRHTFCSRMIDNGIDVKTLQIIMGHADIGTTLNVYTHKDPEDVAKAMEKILLGMVENA
jgi:integrase